MKNWLMLAFLPFLLLVQQEAGANPIYVSTWDGGAGYTYEMIFEFTGNNTYEYYFTFGSSVDLNSIPPLKEGGQGGTCTPPCSTESGSLIGAGILTPVTGIVVMPIVELTFEEDMNGDIYVTGNADPTNFVLSRSVTAGVDGGGTITGEYQCTGGDATGDCPSFFSDSDLLIKSYQTCIQTPGDDDTTNNCASIKKVDMPVVNSFMLLGIGLMALGIPLHRGKPA